MKLFINFLTLCVLTFLSHLLNGADPAKPKLDVHGDPIPAGADICLGTTRFRHGGSGLQVAFTPDGETLVTANSEHAGNMGDRVSFCDVRTGKLVHELKTDQDKIKAFAVSADRKTAAVLTSFYRNRTGFLVMRLADLVKREWISRTEWEPPKQLAYADWGMTFTPDGQTIIMTARGGNVYVWDVASREMILDYKMSLPEKVYINEHPAISSDGETVINVSWEHGIVTWPWIAGKEPAITSVGKHQLIEVAASPVGNLIAFGIADYDGVDVGPDVGLWDIKSKQLVRGFRFPGKTAAMSQIAFSPDGKLLAAADSRSHTISVCNTETGQQVRKFEAVPDHTDSLAFSPDGSLLATAGTDGGAIRVWDVNTGKRIAPELEGHEIYVTLVAFPAKATGQVFSASDDGAIFCWDLASGRPAHTMRHSDWVRGLAVSPDGHLIASSGLSDDNTVRLWDARSGKERFQFPGHGRFGGHRPITFLKNAKQLASFGEDMNLRIWDTVSGKKVAEYPLRPSGIDFSKYRKGAAGTEGASGTGTSQAADADQFSANGELYIDCHGSVFSPDGSLFVFTQGFGKTVYVFDTATGKELHKFDSPHSYNHRAVSPDNRRLAACGPYFGPKDIKKHVVVSDLETGVTVWKHEFDGEFVGRNGPGPITFSHDGRLLAMALCHGLGREDGQGQDSIQIWDTRNQTHLLTIDSIQGICDQYGLSISADNRYLACGMLNSTILVWDLLEQGLPESLIAEPEKQNDKKGDSK